MTVSRALVYGLAVAGESTVRALLRRGVVGRRLAVQLELDLGPAALDELTRGALGEAHRLKKQQQIKKAG